MSENVYQVVFQGWIRVCEICYSSYYHGKGLAYDVSLYLINAIEVVGTSFVRGSFSSDRLSKDK